MTVNIWVAVRRSIYGRRNMTTECFRISLRGETKGPNIISRRMAAGLRYILMDVLGCFLEFFGIFHAGECVDAHRERVFNINHMRG